MTRHLLLLLLLGIAIAAAPALLPSARPQDDDESEIEIGKDPPPPGQDDEETTRKKNAGLAGQGKNPLDDDNAPKVEGSLQQKINEAIKNGVKWLKEAQHEDGSWGPVIANRRYGSNENIGDTPRDHTGPTAFALYTLAKCGEKKRDKTFQKGLKWLKEETMVVFDMTGNKGVDDVGRPVKKELRALTTYESAAIVMLIEAMNEHSAKLTGKHDRRKIYTDRPDKKPSKSKIPQDEWEWMHNRILALTKGRTKGGGKGKGSMTIPGNQNRNGGWRYGQANGDQDLSATQFALLALRAASQAGYPMDKVSPESWRWAAEYAKKCQLGDGSFGYQGPSGGNGSMTACGIVSLVICKEQMELDNVPALPWIDDAIKRGVDAMDRIYQPATNRGPPGGHNYYYMYGVERAGDIIGRKEFGGMDWYVRGAIHLVNNQGPEGKWVDATAYKPQDVLGTCFALLFLKRATPPTITTTGN